MPRIIRLLIGPVCQFAGWFRSLDAALPKSVPECTDGHGHLHGCVAREGLALRHRQALRR